MSLPISSAGPTPRWVKIIRIYYRLHDRAIRGEGGIMRQRRTMARLRKFDRMRRLECPSLIGC
jgi:hypothetical protein